MDTWFSYANKSYLVDIAESLLKIALDIPIQVHLNKMVITIHDNYQSLKLLCKRKLLGVHFNDKRLG